MIFKKMMPNQCLYLASLVLKSQDAQIEFLITSKQKWWVFPVLEIWAFREMLWMFVMRQFSVRYKQMLLGISWVILQPLAQLLITSLVFGIILKVDTGEVPYAIYAFAGLAPWALFARSIESISTTLTNNMDMVSKVYFPRIVLPISESVREAMDGTIQVLILIVVAMMFGYYPNWRFVFLPVFMFYILLTAFVMALPFSCIMVKFRDIRHGIPFLLQVGMFSVPIVYTMSQVPEKVAWLWKYNPMYWGVQGFRWVFIGEPLGLSYAFIFCASVIMVIMVFGWLFFAFFERAAIDVR